MMTLEEFEDTEMMYKNRSVCTLRREGVGVGIYRKDIGGISTYLYVSLYV